VLDYITSSLNLNIILIDLWMIVSWVLTLAVLEADLKVKNLKRRSTSCLGSSKTVSVYVIISNFAGLETLPSLYQCSNS